MRTSPTIGKIAPALVAIQAELRAIAKDGKNPQGLCACGCGEPAPLAKQTNRRFGHVKGQPQRFILGHSVRGLAGERSGSWKGGRHSMTNGYVMVYAPDHPRAKARKYVLEHVLVAERVLGHFLPVSAEVHHFDENPANNAPGNLVICQDRKYHSLLHRRMRAMQACGDPSARRCYFCQGYDRQEDIIVTSQNKTRHRSCDREYQRRKRVAV